VLRNPNASASQRAKMLDILERNVRTQARLIDDLLDLSRLMRDKVELVREPLDLRQVVAAQVEQAATLAARRQITLTLEANELPLPVTGDCGRLGQIVSSVLTNAIKFTDPGGSVIVRAGSAQGHALLSVADTGIGIAPELLPWIFEPFRPNGSATDRSRGGLGIGLAVARSLAQMHGGSLQARSEGLGRGSELTLRLPLRASDGDAMPATVAEALPVAHRRVLLVEDSPDLSDTLAIMLRLLGHTAILAPNGEVALELARTEHPDAALIDIGLPGMNGYELARALRADPATRRIRLVALTGYATAEHRARALAAGFEHHVPKPVDQEELRRLLET